MKAMVLCLIAGVPWGGGAPGTWFVKPEAGEVRTWNHEEISVEKLSVADGAVCLVGPLSERLTLLSPKTGDVLKRWDLRQERRALPADMWQREKGLLNADLLYNGCLFLWRAVSKLVEWPIGASELTREWETGPARSRRDFERVGDWLLVPHAYPDRCEVVGIDLKTGAIAWRASIDRPATVALDYGPRVWWNGASAQTAHWEVEKWDGLHFAVDIPTGEVLSVDLGVPHGGSAYPAYCVHLDKAAKSVTVLREQEVVQKRRGSGEVLWHGEFSDELRPLGTFAVKEGRVLIEFMVHWRKLSPDAKVLGTYAFESPSGGERFPVEAPLSGIPLRGVVAIDLGSGKLLWARTLSLVDLTPAQVHEEIAALDWEVKVGHAESFANTLPREGPFTLGNLVVMRPFTSFVTPELVGHHVVGLDAVTGEIVFLYATPGRKQWYDEVKVVGFVATDSVVCFATRAGWVYGLDLSELVTKERAPEVEADQQ